MPQAAFMKEVINYFHKVSFIRLDLCVRILH
jgi:hypothetical protein